MFNCIHLSVWGLLTRFNEPPETACLIFLSSVTIFWPYFFCPTIPAEFPHILHFCLFLLISLLLEKRKWRKTVDIKTYCLFRVPLKPVQVSLRLGADARSHGHRSRGSDPALRRNPIRTPKRAEFTKNNQKVRTYLSNICVAPHRFLCWMSHVTCIQAYESYVALTLQHVIGVLIAVRYQSFFQILHKNTR